MASVSTSSLTIYPPSHASDEQESVYLSKTRTLHWVRLGIAATILIAAAAVIGCESAPLHRYHETAKYSTVWLPLWPLNLDIRQTNALVACGAIIAFQAIIYIVASVLPSPRPRARLLNFLAAAIAITGLITATIGWQSLGSVNGTTSSGQSLTAPTDFSRMCVESRAGFVLLGLLIGLEIIMGFAAVAGYWLERAVVRQRKMYNLEANQFVMEPKQ
ncbi:hypothetical protein BGW36DRAFT_449306 [Talaromyces proteolyticus]|uniref:Uncharacterized protein n=1 Tax=Talaromyces proteolyticus TaxID=1131652 RepID=A0AAD4KTY4_9EURO|nr:uncharacterized protein BGW36DRAFT_449306 [Talaromyces proteolyticus]KAH8699143.1 hypothetical protein BGW36DRAFT_449306 [Talaromyces proteolyticus]